jgi:hypothetical protein
MCRPCAADIIRALDDLLADGMEPFNPDGRDHCANCLDDLPQLPEPIIIRTGAWRRHTLCPTCAEQVQPTPTRSTGPITAISQSSSSHPPFRAVKV